MLVRRATALGFGVLVLILLVVGINACRSSAKKNSLRDYNQNVGTLATQSDTDVSKPFFALMNDPGNKSPVAIETQINQYRVVAEDIADRAKNLDTPSDMVGAQRNVVQALNLRVEGLQKIADNIRAAKAGTAQSDQAVSAIAGEMQNFLASDVLWSQRVVPLISETLSDNEVTGQRIQSSKFLPSLSWLDPSFVGQHLGASSGGGTSKGGPTAPGTHGHGLTSTSVGTLTLQPGGAVNRIPASRNPVFTVKFMNQGENDERDVAVTVQVTGAGKPIKVRKTVDKTSAGQAASVDVPLGQAPPAGTPVQITTTVGAVPGEKTTDNNKSTYTALFTR
jgi:hypothetical protein